MKKELLDGLYEPFELKVREGLGGMKFKYVASTDIIDRMNKLFKGCWSTEVTSHDRQEDFVVVRVKVSAYDEESNQWFSHDGYGSSTIMRYTRGQNKGQIIDLGNAYKSAETKAIKNACSRWGVGLYLEEASENEGGPFAEPTGGGAGPSSSQTQPAPDISPPPPFPTDNTTSSEGLVPPMPDMPVGAPKEVPKTEAKVEAPPAPTAPDATGPSGITDVQKVAIQGLLQIKSSMFGDMPETERFVKLVEEALGRADNLPKKPDDLTYQDAVTVIKYGNEIDKK